jgi:flagellar biogenesis protein FliO
MNHPQSVLFGVITVRVDVGAMVALGLVFLALVIRAALGIVVVVALAWLVLKLGRLADAYTKKLQTK